MVQLKLAQSLYRAYNGGATELEAIFSKKNIDLIRGTQLIIRALVIVGWNYRDKR